MLFRSSGEGRQECGVSSGSKMAKSTGNIARASELLADGVSPRALRYALISVHYRAGLNYTDDSLPAATAAMSSSGVRRAGLAHT